MINLREIARTTLQSDPYEWGVINNLFSPKDAAALAASFPSDHFKTVAASGGEKDYEYEARALFTMGSYAISYPEELSRAWISLANELLSPDYRIAMSLLTQCDLTAAPMEVNVFHYGPRACLGPHPDLDDKLVTHVLYFNQSWDASDGGNLNILRSGNPGDIAAEIAPIIGKSAVLVRSQKSWHSVSRVVNGCRDSRRSLTATFYRQGSISSMWPPGEETQLHSYNVRDLNA